MKKDYELWFTEAKIKMMGKIKQAYIEKYCNKNKGVHNLSD